MSAIKAAKQKQRDKAGSVTQADPLCLDGLKGKSQSQNAKYSTSTNPSLKPGICVPQQTYASVRYQLYLPLQ